MHCEQAEMLLGQFVFDELDDAQRSQVDEHLAQCPTCSEMLGDMRVTLNLLNEAAAIESKPMLGDERRVALLRELSREPARSRARRVIEQFRSRTKSSADRAWRGISVVFTIRGASIAAASVLLCAGVLGLLMPTLGVRRASVRSEATPSAYAADVDDVAGAGQVMVDDSLSMAGRHANGTELFAGTTAQFQVLDGDRAAGAQVDRTVVTHNAPATPDTLPQVAFATRGGDGTVSFGSTGLDGRFGTASRSVTSPSQDKSAAPSGQTTHRDTLFDYAGRPMGEAGGFDAEPHRAATTRRECLDVASAQEKIGA